MNVCPCLTGEIQFEILDKEDKINLDTIAHQYFIGSLLVQYLLSSKFYLKTSDIAENPN